MTRQASWRRELRWSACFLTSIQERRVPFPLTSVSEQRLLSKRLWLESTFHLGNTRKFAVHSYREQHSKRQRHSTPSFLQPLLIRKLKSTSPSRKWHRIPDADF